MNKTFLILSFLFSLNFQKYANETLDKINLVIYYLEGRNFDKIEKDRLFEFIDLKLNDEKFVLTAFVNYNNNLKILHFNDDKLLNVNKEFLKDTIYKYSLEHSLKNEFDKIEPSQISILEQYKKIYDRYIINSSDSKLTLYNFISISDPSKLTENSSSLIPILNQIKLLSMVKSENNSIQYIISDNKKTAFSPTASKMIEEKIKILNQNNKYEIFYK